MLVAEDERLAADPLSFLLEEEKAQVAGPFQTSAFAIEPVEARKADFAVVDMHLRDGFADMLVQKLMAYRFPMAL